MNVIMTIRNTIQKGEVRTNKKGDRYIFMWNETQYCFPQEVWDIIKEYWGFIPNFPVNFGSMYSRYADMNKSKKVSDFDLRSVNWSIKRELGNLYYPNWFKQVKQEFLATGNSGDHYIYPIEVDEFDKRHQLKFWLKQRKGDIDMIYSRISEPFNFLHCDFKVGDKILLAVSAGYGDPILFKQGGDKDNVVPTEDIADYTISHNSKAVGKSVFSPRYKTTDGEEFYEYVPVIITSISALKVKMDYYKYNIIEETRINTSDVYYTDSVVYSADWSVPRGKIVCGWGQKNRVIRKNDVVVRNDNIDTITQERYTKIIN